LGIVVITRVCHAPTHSIPEHGDPANPLVLSRTARACRLRILGAAAAPSFSAMDPGERARTIVALDRDACATLLATETVGRVAVSLPDGTPIIRPVNYVFDAPSQSVVFRAGLGSHHHALWNARRAAFEVDRIDPVARTGWSVVVTGVTEEIVRPDELRRISATGLDPWAPGERTHWFRVRAFVVSGRRIRGKPA
jgi:uncharacterized protein